MVMVMCGSGLVTCQFTRPCTGLYALGRPCTGLYALGRPCTGLYALGRPCTGLYALGRLKSSQSDWKIKGNLENMES